MFKRSRAASNDNANRTVTSQPACREFFRSSKPHPFQTVAVGCVGMAQKELS